MSATATARPIALGPSLGRTTVVLATGVALVVVAAAVAVALGTSGVAPDQVLAIVLHRVTGMGAVTWPASAETIVLELRLPRVVAGMVVGAGLACAGTVFQALLRNPLADPYIIGTAAGASLGAVAALLLPVATIGWLGIGTVQAFAFAGGLGAVLVVFAVARGRGGTPVVTLLLAGYAISSLLSAGVAFLLFTSGDRLAAVVSWLLGSLAGASWPRLAIAAPIIIVAFSLLLVRWRRLNALLLGEAAAAGLGVEQWLAQWQEDVTLLGRLPTLTQIADAAVFLASVHAAAITGAVIDLSCGSAVRAQGFGGALVGVLD
jgi:iron complex transport system permease protein